ncbi:MAG TPA: hypothetical protein ENO20_03780 [Bacteroides sp.]|nr:hypothetical protein [Bacteroides sp.]
MKQRYERLMEIRRLIGQSQISSQDELMRLLEKQGFELTQATLSRDLKYLKVAKMPDDRTGYVYVLPGKEQESRRADLATTADYGFVSIDFAQGLGIVKTLPGHAGSLAYTIDQLNAYEVAGTVAGDDTILIIPRDGVTRHDLVSLLQLKVPGLIFQPVH